MDEKNSLKSRRYMYILAIQMINLNRQKEQAEVLFEMK